MPSTWQPLVDCGDGPSSNNSGVDLTPLSLLSFSPSSNLVDDPAGATLVDDTQPYDGGQVKLIVVVGVLVAAYFLLKKKRRR